MRRSDVVLILALLAIPAADMVAVAETIPLPDTMEAPEPRPDPNPSTPEDPDGTGNPATVEPPPLPLPGPDRAPTVANDGELPDEEKACRARLRELGAGFSEHPPIAEPDGCSAAHPLLVDTLPGDVELRPAAVLTCAMAEATARFTQDQAAPLAESLFGSRLAAIEQVSSYVCRPRSGGGKLSEHAFANALDWGALTLADGTTIEVRAYREAEPRRARLIEEIHKAACGPFRTVLGPGSDADHADHFHFDMAERRGGGTWCE